MARSFTPVTNSESFAQWVGVTNNMIDAFGQTVTVAANSTGDITTGNGHVNGSFSANVLAASTLRGGNVQSSANLTITSNLSITGANTMVSGNLHAIGSSIVFSSNSSIDALTIVGGSSTNTTVAGNNMTVAANLSITGQIFRMPTGTTAARPGAPGTGGLMRFNTDSSLPEIWQGNTWLTISAFSNGIVAAAISFNSSSNITSNNVQNAVMEVEGKKVNRTGDVMTGNLVANLNGGTLPTAPSGSIIQLAGPDSSNAEITIDAFGATPRMSLRRADFSNPSKAALANNVAMASYSAAGYDGNTYLYGDASIDIYSAEAFTNTAHGTKIVLVVTNLGANTKNNVLTIGSSGATVNTVLTVSANLSVTGVMSGNGASLTSVNSAFLEGHNTAYFANATYVAGLAGTSTPLVDGTAAVGTSTQYARQDHVHPTDTSRAALASPTFTGTPAAPTAPVDTNTTQLATTAFVLAQAASATPTTISAAAVGTSTRYARADHNHGPPAFSAITGKPTTVSGYGITDQVAYLNTTGQNITGGATVTSLGQGTVSSGTVTLDPASRPMWDYTNGGAHTLSPSTNKGTVIVDITNSGTAGAITLTGWTKTVGSFDTTSGHIFRCICSIGVGGSLLQIQNMF